MIGQTFSHYTILAEISRGGMGVVYRALDLKLDREVAFKVLPPELVADSERKRRFVLEAKAAAKLEHPHIGVVHEIDEADGVTFIAMELIRGEQLRDALEGKRLPLERSLEIATEITEGLSSQPGRMSSIIMPVERGATDHVLLKMSPWMEDDSCFIAWSWAPQWEEARRVAKRRGYRRRNRHHHLPIRDRSLRNLDRLRT